MLSTLLQKTRPVWIKASFKKYLKNTGWIFFSSIARLITSFVTVLITIRILGPENYGQLSYTISFVALFWFIVGLGINNIMYRELVTYPDQKNAYLGTAFRITFISAFIAQILTLISAFLFSDIDVSFWAIFILSFNYYFGGAYIVASEFQADVNAKISSIIFAISFFVTSLIKILLVLEGKGVLYLAAVMVFETFLILILIMYARNKIYGPIKEWYYDQNIATKLIRDSWPLMLVSALAVIYTKVDHIMIKNILDARSVGLYDAPVRIIELWLLIPATIITSLFPALVNAKIDSQHTFKTRIVYLGSFLVCIAIGSAVFLSLFSDMIVHILFGKEFEYSTGVLQIYAWSIIASSITLLLHQFLIIKNKVFVLLLIMIPGLLANITLNALFIPTHGIQGAAWATFISCWIPSVTWLILCRTHINKLDVLRFLRTRNSKKHIDE